MNDEITEPTLKLCWNAHAIRRAAEVLRAAGLQLMAEDVEAQFPKPAIEEPLETFSVVKARDKQRDDSGLFWIRAHGGWMDDKVGRFRAWHLLAVSEVLRVGIGEQSDEWQRLDVANAQTEAYSRGYEDGVASNRPSPVDRSNIKSAIREAIAKITMREGRLIGEDHSYELADAVMKVMADEPATQRFCSLRRDCRMADGHQGACQP